MGYLYTIWWEKFHVLDGKDVVLSVLWHLLTLTILLLNTLENLPFNGTSDYPRMANTMHGNDIPSS